MGFWDTVTGWLKPDSTMTMDAHEYYKDYGRPIIQTVRDVGIRNTALLGASAAARFGVVGGVVGGAVGYAGAAVMLARDSRRQSREIVERDRTKAEGRARGIMDANRRQNDLLSSVSRRADISRGDYRRILENRAVKDAYDITARNLRFAGRSTPSSFVHRDPTSRINWSNPRVMSAYQNTVAALHRGYSR